jgi:hypothetical protein
MRLLPAVMLLFALVLSSCARKKPAQAPPSASPRAGTGAAPASIVLGGTVSKVEPASRFVVLSFPPSQMPAVDQRLSLYRHGAKVAEVKVSGPQRDNNIVADIVTGAPEEGDEVRVE